jgi:hypothetical protein
LGVDLLEASYGFLLELLMSICRVCHD